MAGRPRTVSDDDLLQAAARVVARHGPGGLTFAAVSAEAGVVPSAVAQRFGSKHGLLVALAEQHVRDVEALVAAATAAPGPALARLHRLLAALLPPHATPEALATGVAFLHLDLVDPDLAERARRHQRALERGLARLLRQAEAAGELAPGTPRSLAHTVLVARHGAVVTWALDPRGPLPAAVRRSVDTALAPHQAA